MDPASPQTKALFAETTDKYAFGVFTTASAVPLPDRFRSAEKGGRISFKLILTLSPPEDKT